MTTTFSIVAVAGATLAALAGAVPGYASSMAPAARARPAMKTVTDTVFAGYVTTGAWRFRHVAATVPIAKCRSQATQNAAARIALTSGLTSVAHIDVFCGGGQGSVRFGAVLGETRRFSLSPHLGEALRISVYRNVAACRDEFTATNASTHRSDRVIVRTPCRVIYRHAQLGGVLLDFTGRFTPPTTNVRLWSIRDLAITSYDGRRGTPCGPWPAEKHLAAPVIAVRMIPSDLVNRCRDFDLVLKGRS